MSDIQLRVNQDWYRVMMYIQGGTPFIDTQEPGIIQESALQPVPPFPWQTEVLRAWDREWFNDPQYWRAHPSQPTEAITCPICSQWLSSPTTWWDHCSGKKHRKKVQQYAADRCRSRTRRANGLCRLPLWWEEGWLLEEQLES